MARSSAELGLMTLNKGLLDTCYTSYLDFASRTDFISIEVKFSTSAMNVNAPTPVRRCHLANC